MRRMGIVGLGVATVFGFGLVGVVGVAAAVEIDPAPERGVCKRVLPPTATSSDSTCENEVTTGGSFVWVPQTEAAYTLTTGTVTLKSLAPAGAELPPVECKKSKGKGTSTATVTKGTVTFEECSSAGEICTGGIAARVGQIITFELEGTLGIVKDGVSDEDIVGEDIVGKGPGGLSSEFKCGAATSIETRGSVIGVVSPVEGPASTTNTLVFAEGAPGKQAVESFEGGPNDTLQTEIDGFGDGTFPFDSVEITTASVKGRSGSVRA